MHYVFPDTNIFIHGKHFEQINWAELVGHSEVSLVIAPVVITELDKHKYNPNARIAKRVKRLLPRLESILSNAETSKWQIIRAKKAGDIIFEQHDLDKKEGDDQILAAIIHFQQGLYREDAVTFVTNDTGPRLKAADLSITSIKLSDDLLLTQESDESEKQIAQLESQLKKFQFQSPEVSLSFEENQLIFTIKRLPPLASREAYVSEKLNEMRSEFTPLAHDRLVNGGGETTMQSPSNLTLEQVGKYNKQLLLFFNNYFIFWEENYIYETFCRNSTALTIQLNNTGHAPALDLDIVMIFPEGFEIISEENLIREPKKPDPPYKPKSRLDFTSTEYPRIDMTSAFQRNYLVPPVTGININESGPEIKKINGYELSFHVNRIKHNQAIAFEPIILNFPDISVAKGFTIDYKILAGNIPSPVTGKLFVKFENKLDCE